MALNNKKQSTLERKGIDERNNEIRLSRYSKNEAYSESHENALSDPTNDKKYLGKGTGSGGFQHPHSRPNHDLPPTLMNYSNLDTHTEAGGAYDIHGKNGVGGRNWLKDINLYNIDNAYSANSIDMSENIDNDQYVI
jgi:hypothetical protein